MSVMQQVTQEADELFKQLSPSSRAALAVAEAARDQLNDEGIEIAHLLYGLYQKDTGPTRRTFNAAEIDNNNLLAVLGLDRLDPNAAGGKTRELSGMPRLAHHAQQALVNANHIRSQRRDDQIRSRHLLAGALSITECSLVRELLSERRLSFDLDSYEQAEREVASQKSNETPISDGDPILLTKIGATEIFVQDTTAPLRLQVDAFGLFVDKDYPQNILPDVRLRSELGEDRWSQLREAISSSESRFESSPWGFSVGLVDTPDALRGTGLPPHFLVAKARDYTSLVPCAKAIVWRAAKEQLSKIALPLNPRTVASFGTEDAVVETIKFVLQEREFGSLTAITLTSRERGKAEELVKLARESANRWLWESISANARRAFEWAAAAAGAGDGPGEQKEITPLQLLSGLVFITVDGKRPPVSEFVLDTLATALPPTDDAATNVETRIASILQVPPTLSPETLSDFPPLANDVRRAFEVGLRIKPLGRNGVHARDLTAALLLRTEPSRDPIAARELSSLGFELSELSQKFL